MKKSVSMPDRLFGPAHFQNQGVSRKNEAKSLIALALLALRVALSLDLGQAFLGALDRFANHAPVKFNLRFSRTATVANTATLALKVRPAPDQSGAEVLQPGQFDLQFTLVAASALGKDLQNQHGAIVDRHAQMALEVALLRR
jgi:hypothetical protein